MMRVRIKVMFIVFLVFSWYCVRIVLVVIVGGMLVLIRIEQKIFGLVFLRVRKMKMNGIVILKVFILRNFLSLNLLRVICELKQIIRSGMFYQLIVLMGLMIQFGRWILVIIRVRVSRLVIVGGNFRVFLMFFFSEVLLLEQWVVMNVIIGIMMRLLVVEQRIVGVMLFKKRFVIGKFRVVVFG